MFDLSVYLKFRPIEYDFYQLIRLAECLYNTTQQSRSGMLLSDDPLDKEFLSFSQQADLGFVTQGVLHVERDEEHPHKNRLHLAMFGLYGSHGVLPPFYTELINQRARQGDHAFRAYLDALNSRTLGFLFTAWNKNRYPFIHERRSRLEQKNPFRGTNIIAGVTGSQFNAFDQLPSLKQISSYFSGYFSNQRKTLVGYKAIMSKLIGVDVTIEPFYARHYKLPESESSLLGVRGSSLGKNMIIGNEIVDGNMSIRVTTSPIGYPCFQQLQPGQQLFMLVSQVTEQYLGIGYDVELRLVLKSKEVPETVLSAGVLTNSSCLGYNTWLSGRQPGMDADDVSFMLNGKLG